MNRTFFVAAAVLAVMPGGAAAMVGLLAPPGHGAAFGLVLGIGSTLALLVVVTLGPVVRRRPRDRVIPIVLRCGIAGLVGLLAYLVLFGHCLISASAREPEWAPLWATGTLASMIDAAGSRAAALTRYGNAAIADAIDAVPGWIRLASDGLLLVVLLSANCLFVTAFTVLALRPEVTRWTKTQAVTGAAPPSGSDS